jgi:hypothetical protein
MSTETSTDAKMVAVVNISTEKWPPRHRTYFGTSVACKGISAEGM